VLVTSKTPEEKSKLYEAISGSSEAETKGMRRIQTISRFLVFI